MDRLVVGTIPTEGELIYLKLNEIEIGCIHVIFTPDYFVIHSLYIDKDYRGNGYSKILLNNVIESAKNKDYCNIRLQCQIDNKEANSLYKSYGFEAISLIGTELTYNLELCELIEK